jgi:hypothetical protein
VPCNFPTSEKWHAVDGITRSSLSGIISDIYYKQSYRNVSQRAFHTMQSSFVDSADEIVDELGSPERRVNVVIQQEVGSIYTRDRRRRQLTLGHHTHLDRLLAITCDTLTTTALFIQRTTEQTDTRQTKEQKDVIRHITYAGGLTPQSKTVQEKIPREWGRYEDGPVDHVLPDGAKPLDGGTPCWKSKLVRECAV